MRLYSALFNMHAPSLHWMLFFMGSLLGLLLLVGAVVFSRSFRRGLRDYWYATAYVLALAGAIVGVYSSGLAVLEQSVEAGDFAARGCRILRDPGFEVKVSVFRKHYGIASIQVGHMVAVPWPISQLMSQRVPRLIESEEIDLSLEQARAISRIMRESSDSTIRNDASRLLASR